MSVKFASAPVSLTISNGLALASQTDADPAELLQRADALLYRAKAAGRNRVCADEGWAAADAANNAQPAPAVDLNAAPQGRGASAS